MMNNENRKFSTLIILLYLVLGILASLIHNKTFKHQNISSPISIPYPTLLSSLEDETTSINSDYKSFEKNTLEFIKRHNKKIYPHEKEYIKDLLDKVWTLSFQYEVDPYKIVAIIYLESRWRKISRPSPTNDFGPMQINQIHTKIFGKSFKTNLLENVRIGIIIFKLGNEKFWRYNVSKPKDAYNKEAIKFYQKLIAESKM